MSALAARIPSREQVGSYLTWRRLPGLLALGLIAFALVYVLFLAEIPGDTGATNWRTTTFGSAVHDPSSFLKVVLDSLTFAAALFIVASGFALIFGLMRTVNMAHGAFYLLGRLHRLRGPAEDERLTGRFSLDQRPRSTPGSGSSRS